MVSGAFSGEKSLCGVDIVGTPNEERGPLVEGREVDEEQDIARGLMGRGV